jgi:hypothetical protein
MTLITQEQIRQQREAVQIHADGLRKIVELRGGLNQLEGDIGLAIKVCKWAGSCLFDSLMLTSWFSGRMLCLPFRLAQPRRTLGMQQPAPTKPWQRKNYTYGVTLCHHRLAAI